MYLLWIFAGVFAVIKGQECPHRSVYNGCGESLKSNISSVWNPYALTFEDLNYICGSGSNTVKCFLKGLRDCPNSKLTFQSEFILQQWNVALIEQLLVSGCQTPESQAFMSNYACLKANIESTNFSTCLSQAVAANPLGVNSLISCGLQMQGKTCVKAHIRTNCINQTALNFFLKWNYIQGNFAFPCGTVNGIESLKMVGTFPLVITIYIFLMLLM
ncbi:hypothetical protein ACJMK2_017505 [Sinanodonta woodiana]|uniref:Uncharacterized protein n=1 Tax=Sinanodonta woodiana TaxID=1069815 RepID=A0ABD3UC31_SINWO